MAVVNCCISFLSSSVRPVYGLFLNQKVPFIKFPFVRTSDFSNRRECGVVKSGAVPFEALFIALFTNWFRFSSCFFFLFLLQRHGQWGSSALRCFYRTNTRGWIKKRKEMPPDQRISMETFSWTWNPISEFMGTRCMMMAVGVVRLEKWV